MNSPVVFCHIDLQGGNILHRESNATYIDHVPLPDELIPLNKRLIVIDYEYCSYNFRAYDIANHFAEWEYDYAVEEPPCYTSKPEKYPTKEAQYRFISSYVEFMVNNEPYVHSKGNKMTASINNEIQAPNFPSEFLPQKKLDTEPVIKTESNCPWCHQALMNFYSLNSHIGFVHGHEANRIVCGWNLMKEPVQ